MRHEKRPDVTSATPVHVSIRLKDGTLKLRMKRIYRIVREALWAAAQKIRFRLIEYSVQDNHLHLICEADDTYALSRAMRSLSIRIAKRLNQAMGTRGERIPQRYFMRVLKTANEVRIALQYVLNNYRRHAAQRNVVCERGWVDPFSSGVWFGYWSPPPAPARDPCEEVPRPTVEPKSDVLSILWMAYGLIDPSFVPGPWSEVSRSSAAEASCEALHA